jgi:16S rRNA (cytosine1402-N4)-methyltransferase
MKQKHQPVLLEQTLELLNPKPGESYLDGTAGYGGHAAQIVSRIGSNGRVVLVDRDVAAIRSLKELFDDRAEIIQANFLDAANILAENGNVFDLILLDLGVSSPQLDEHARGFSFNSEEPLDMRMDQTQTLSALEVVNSYSEHDLADIIYRFGEEPRSRSIAKAICRARPIKTAAELADVIRKVVPRTKSIDPATRTFQAIRIEVNAELSSLAEALPVLVEMLAPGGRIVVISFHSLEDRIVKQYFEKESRDCICPPRQPICNCDHVATLAKLTTKAIIGQDKDVNNPRARSAKLRAAVKIKPKIKGG